MQQSTIYRRHEARRQRTLKLQDDTRPPAVRVLSGLPGFRMIIPPYQPSSDKGVYMAKEVIIPPYQPSSDKGVYMAKEVPRRRASFSEETVFSSYDNLAITKKQQVTDERNPTQIAFAAAIGAAVVGALFGPKSSAGWPRHGASRVGVTVQGSNSLAFHHVNDKVFGLPAPTAGAVTSTMATAGSTALLFGTKALVSQRLGESTPYVLVLSSACAGAALATVYTPLEAVQSQTMLLPQRYRIFATKSLIRSQCMTALIHTAPTVYAREMVGVALLFGSYDAMKQCLVGRDESQSNVAIALSGAVAGSAYKGFTYAVNTRKLTPQLRSGRSLLPVVLRSAPQYATLFVCYEGVLACLSPSHRV